jgi:hypothetical protein
MNKLRVFNLGARFDSPAGTIGFKRLNRVLYPSAYPPRIRARISTSKNVQKTDRKFAAIPVVAAREFMLADAHV